MATEKELIIIFKNLKEYWTILPVQLLLIYSDYKHITCKFWNTDRVLLCILILEEHDIEIEYIQGKNIIVAYEPLQLPNHGNKKNKHHFNCIMETIS